MTGGLVTRKYKNGMWIFGICMLFLVWVTSDWWLVARPWGSVAVVWLDEHGDERGTQRFCSDAMAGEMLRCSLYYKVLWRLYGQWNMVVDWLIKGSGSEKIVEFSMEPEPLESCSIWETFHVYVPKWYSIATILLEREKEIFPDCWCGSRNTGSTNLKDQDFSNRRRQKFEMSIFRTQQGSGPANELKTVFMHSLYHYVWKWIPSVTSGLVTRDWKYFS